MSIITLPKMDRVILSHDAKVTLNEEVARLEAKRVFLIASTTLSRTTTVVDELVHALGKRFAGLYTDIAPHTPSSSIIACAKSARHAFADLIVTVGGGSITDAGKIAALCMSQEIERPEQLKPFFNSLDADGNRHEPTFNPPDVRVICIPTTLSGGEFNYRAGLTDTQLARKHIIGHPLMIPSSVILSPSISRHTPRDLYLSTGIRALDHAVETLCSIDANPYTDALAQQAIKLLYKGLQDLHNNETNDAARMDCHVGAWLSMTGVVGRLRLGASHAIGHVLGARAGMPHGHTSCVMLATVMRYNESNLEQHFSKISEAMGNRDRSPSDHVAQLVKELHLPHRLRDCGVTAEMLPDLAQECMSESWIYSNCKPIKSWKDVLGLLEAAY